jgi:multicomponent Na+:H+ antiporter subunit G
MIEYVTGALLLSGAFFLVIAAVGLIKMPDLFMRMSTSTKASVLCVGLVLTGGAVHFSDLAVTTKAVAVIVFIGLTAPVAAHMIGRAAYREGVSLWPGTTLDDLAGKYGRDARDPQRPDANPGPPAS